VSGVPARQAESTAEAAIADATSAAREWAEHWVGKGKGDPVARPVRQITRDGELDVAADETAVMVPLLLASGRSVRASLSLNAALLAAIDDAARPRGLTHSAFVASAAREK
jgi:hypothetical protein